MVDGIQKRGSTWYYRIRVGDHLVGEGGFADPQAAQAARDKVRVAAREGRLPAVPTRETVAEYLERWLRIHESQVKPTTLASYRMHVDRHIIPVIGDLPLKKLDRATLATFYAGLRRRARPRGKEQMGERSALAPATVRRIAATLHKALADAVDEGTLGWNPGDRVKLPKEKAGELRELRAWEAGELKTFLKATEGDRLAPMWRLFAYTGMRRGEVVGLNWRDVDLKAGTISVRRALAIVGTELQETTPKRGRARVIDLDSATTAALEDWRKCQARERDAWPTPWPEGHRVFTHEDGSDLHPDLVTRAFGRHVKTAGVPRIRLHDVRRTHASLLLRAGAPVKVVSERLGHADVAFTMRVYQSVLPGMQQETANSFASLIEAAETSRLAPLRK
jgi:integrase